MGRSIFRIVIPVVVLAAVAAGQDSSPKPVPGEPTKSKEKSPELAWPELVILDKFAGPWNVSESHYNSKGDVIGSAKGIEEGTWVLDRRVMRRTYTTGEEGNLYRAIGMITWDPASKVYRGTWFDNRSTIGPTAITGGSWIPEAKMMKFTLTSVTADREILQYEVTDRFLDDDHRIVTTFKVIDKEVQKVLEVQFTRAHPCPANVGIIPETPKSDGPN